MPKLFLVIGLSLLLSATSDGQTDASEGATRSKLIALENAWNQAQLHHDSKALDSLVGEKFVYTDTDGTVLNKAGFLRDIKDPNYRATLMANEGVTVNLYENVAVVFGTYHSRGTYKGVAFDRYGRFTDTWILRKGKWECVASHTTAVKK